MSGAAAGADGKKLVEALLGDLRLLTQEAKKKHTHVKEAAESGVVRVRNISTASSDASLFTNLRAASSELLHPLALACTTRQTRLVQIALQGIQRLVQHRILEASCASVVVSELWGLVEAECEELRVLQTVPPLVSSDLLVTGNNLAKCIVMCFRMHFARDPVVINAASAAVRQLVAGVFERVVQEDGVFSGELTVVPPSGGRPSVRSAPPTLRPCAADAYMLFRDLCLLMNAEPAIWLTGMREITRTLGLELLESLLKGFPGVFHKHSEMGELVRRDVCQVVIKLFSPNLKSVQVSSQHPATRAVASVSSGSPPDRPNFPIAMRLVRIVVVLITFYGSLLPTECEIFVSHLLKFLETDKKGWQRALSLEALHRIVSKPEILRWMSETLDGGSSDTRLIEQMACGLAAASHQAFHWSHHSSETDEQENMGQAGQPGFLFRGVWLPYIEQLSAKKSLLLDSLERHEACSLPDGYVVSRSLVACADMTQALFAAVDSFAVQDENNATGSENIAAAVRLFEHSQPGLLSAVSQLLVASCEETITDQLLCSLCTLVGVGCRLKQREATYRCLYALASAALPNPHYMARFAGFPVPESSFKDELVLDEGSGGATHAVVATGSPCPSPVVTPDLWNQQVITTAKNLQAARVLLTGITVNAAQLDKLWYLTLAACQHLAWLLAIRPSASGLFVREKSETETTVQQNGYQTTVTTAALADVPVLASYMDKIASLTTSLSDSDLMNVIDAVMRLSDEQIAVAATGRDCSLYPLATLLRISIDNLGRMALYWAKVTTHFNKVCGHTSPALRDWSASWFTTLIKGALKAKTKLGEESQQAECLQSLSLLSVASAPEVRKRQLDCLMTILQTDGALLRPNNWPIVIRMLCNVVDNENGCDEALVRQGYLGIRLVSSDFLQSLPFDCVSDLVEAIARYGRQNADHNISLSGLALLWTVSDYVFRKSETVGADAAEKVWLVLYTCLSELCVDSRHSVRKSACHTLLQTVAAHGQALRPHTWTHLIWEMLMPLLDRVRSQTRSASTEKSSMDLIMHHSRDTEQKQWTETCIHVLSAAAKVFNAQRRVLLSIDDFGSAWEALLSYMEWAACFENAELSLSAIKSFQEILLGKVSAQTLDINTRERSTTSLEGVGEDIVPVLPQAQWIDSWNSWQRISRGLAKLGSAATASNGTVVKGMYIPGPSHLTSLLHIFPPLFERVAKHISADELAYEQLPSVLESLVNVPIPLEQTPFVLPSSSSQLTPTQEAVLDAIKAVYQECVSTGSLLRSAVADIIRMLIRFASLATRYNGKHAPPGKNYRDWAQQCIIPFAETSLRLSVEIFVATANFSETIQSLIVVDLVQFLGEPLYLKSQCISPTTWRVSSSLLTSVLKTAVPLARQPKYAEHFASLWMTICETLEKYLFTPNVCSRLPADERKRDELAECQLVELVRTDMLPHAARLPSDAVARLIAILNKGSISQLDPTDVLASDSHAQRAELARACFDALLSTSSDGDALLGHVAVSSLLQRCSQVMTEFVRDWSGSGDLSLPRTRIFEISSALQAVDSLIARLARDPTLPELYSQLVHLYPTVADVVPACRADPQLEAQLVTTLKSFQTLMLLQAVPTFQS